MNSPSDHLSQLLAHIQNLAAQDSVREALRVLSDLEAETKSLPSNALVLKSRLIQLDDETSNHTLAESEMALHEALSLDDNCIESLLELGWIHLNIRRDVRRACSYSEKALQRWAEEGFSMGR